jgi:hypothetical protein
MLFVTAWPALLMLPVVTFAFAMTVAAVISAVGTGVLSQIAAVIAGTLAGTAAAWGVGMALGIAAPLLFNAAFALERAAAFAPFAFIGGIAGVAWERGHTLTSLWR